MRCATCQRAVYTEILRATNMTHAITLDLPEEVYEPLKRMAEDNGQSLEDLAVKWLTTVVQRLDGDPLEQFIGAFNSHGADWADEHDRHLGQSLATTMQGQNPAKRSDG